MDKINSKDILDNLEKYDSSELMENNNSENVTNNLLSNDNSSIITKKE